MTNHNTKKSLKASGLALFVCIAMLIGTTFAWFTDSITNSGNIIQSGSLSIGAVAYDTGAGGVSVTIPGVNADKAITFEKTGQDLKTNKDPIINDNLFEPGKSNAKLLQVTNKGTLAAKLKLDFDVKDGGLQDALWFDFVQIKDGAVVGDFTKRPMSQLDTIGDKLELPLVKANDNLQFALIYGMNEDAGNDYQNKDFTASVVINATQYTAEEDGFGSDQYDKDANYNVAVKGDEAIIDALKDESVKNIDITSDFTVTKDTERMNISSDKNIDFKGNTFTRASGAGNGLLIGEKDYNPYPVNVVIENANFESSDTSPAVRVESGSTVTFKNSSFVGVRDVFQANGKKGKTTLIFENCTFDNNVALDTGEACEYDVVFKNCKFDIKEAGHGQSAVKIDARVYGNISFEDSTIVVQAKGNGTSGINVGSYPGSNDNKDINVALKNTRIETVSPANGNPSEPIRINSEAITKLTYDDKCVFIKDGQKVTY